MKESAGGTVNPCFRRSSHARPHPRRTRGGNTPAVPPAGPARQGVGPDPRRDLAGPAPRPGPRDRQPRAAFGDGERVLRQRRRRHLGVEGRLRGVRGRADHVSAQIRRRDAHPRGLSRRDARDDDPARVTSADADPALRGIRAVPAILDAIGARFRRRRSGRHHAFRSRARTLGRHRNAGDLRRTGQRALHSTKSPRRGPACLPACSAASRSPATTPSRSTTGSTRRSGRAWC